MNNNETNLLNDLRILSSECHNSIKSESKSRTSCPTRQKQKHDIYPKDNHSCPCVFETNTICMKQCGYCHGCLTCFINRESKCNNCIPLSLDCSHLAFNKNHPTCPCDDGETTMCIETCEECGGCIECPVNLAMNDLSCNCRPLQIDCMHSSSSVEDTTELKDIFDNLMIDPPIEEFSVSLPISSPTSATSPSPT